MPVRNNMLAGNILPSGGFAPAIFQGNTFTPQQADMNLLARSLDKIEQREIATNQQRGAIAKALADVELNEAEDEWKTNYANKIQDEINGLIAFGDYSNALNRAAVLAGKSLADPALRGRVRAQRDYKTFVDNTLARKDLTEDDKSWALAMNPYKYEDKFDSNGNVVGGTDWKPTTRPVGEIDYNKLLATAKQMVFQESGGATQVVFYDAEGRDTNNPLAAEGVKYYKNGSWQGISKKKLTDLVEAAIDNEPGARARLDQDWAVANWKYDQLSDEEKANNRPPELFASNGKKYTKQEWYNNKFGRAIDAMSGMNYTSSIKYDDDYSKFMAARRAGALTSGGNANDPFNGQIQLATGLGTPAQIETSSIVNKAFGKVDSGVQDIEKAVPGVLKNTKAWINAKNSGDYTTLANLTLSYARSGDRENRQFLEDKAKELKDNDSLIKSIRKNTSNADYNAISFNGAFTTGGELPSNNIYTKHVMDIYNNIGGPNATQLRYSFEDSKELEAFANTVGIDINKVKRTVTEDGLPAIVLDKSDTRNYKAMAEYANAGYLNERTSVLKDISENGFWRGISRFRYRNINALDDNGTVLDGKWDAAPINSSNKRMFWAANAATEINNTFNRTNRRSKNIIGSVASNIVTTTTKHMELPGVLAARVQYADDPSKQNTAVNEQIDMVTNNILGMNGSQYEIMTFDNNTNTLASSNIKDRTEALENIKSYLLSDSNKNKYILGLRIIDGKVGYRIQIPKDWNKSKNTFVDGDIEPGEIVIFNPDDPYLQKMQRDSKFIAATKYDRLSRINGASHNTYDNNELKFDNGIPYINRRPVSREEAISYLDKDEAYTQLKFGLGNNITSSGTLTADYANALAQFIASYYGYPINSPANIEKAGDLINQMQNELR